MYVYIVHRIPHSVDRIDGKLAHCMMQGYPHVCDAFRATTSNVIAHGFCLRVEGGGGGVEQARRR